MTLRECRISLCANSCVKQLPVAAAVEVQSDRVQRWADGLTGRPGGLQGYLVSQIQLQRREKQGNVSK